MKRIALGLLIGALVFAGAVGAKVVTVTNPMSGDLNAGGYSISNANDVSGVSFSANNSPLATSVFAGGVFLADFSAGNYTAAGLHVGAADPSVAPGVLAGRGSLYLRDTGTTGELWEKTGPDATGWQRFALAP